MKEARAGGRCRIRRVSQWQRKGLVPSRGCLFEQRKAPADTLGGILRSLIGRAEGRSHQEPKGTAADRSPSP